ncbi:Hpt domain-containing protein, partial [Thermosulfuriphilus sp.]
MEIRIRADELEVLKGFLEEAWEHLDGIEDKILELEERQDPETVNAIFRPVHTIKGTAAFLGLNNIKELCHKTETLLDRIRKQELTITPETIDLLLNATDLISQMLQATEEALEGLREEGEEIVLQVRDVDYQEILGALEAAQRGRPPKKAEDLTQASEEEAPPPKTPGSLELAPGLKDQFLEEAEEHLANIEGILLRLEKKEASLEELNELFRSLHTLKGNAGVLLSTIDDPTLAQSHPLNTFKDKAHRAEELVERCRDEERLPSEEEIEELLKTVDLLRSFLEGLEEGLRDPAPLSQAPEPEIKEAEIDSSRTEVLLNALSQAMEAAKVGLEEIKDRERRQTALAKVGRAFEMIIKIAQKIGKPEVKEEAEKSYNIIDFMANNEEPEEHEEILIEGIKEGFRL